MTIRSVLHVSQPVDGGVARVVADLAADQAERRWRVVVACPPRGRLPQWLREASVDHASWEARRGAGFRSLGQVRRIRRIVRAVSPDVVHLHSSTAGLAGRLAVRGRRCTVFQPHAWSFEAVEGALRRLVLSWERLAVRWTDTVVCVSGAERDRGEGVGLRARFRVVPNGVDLRVLREASVQDRVAARRALALGGGPLVVSVGRLSRQKGQDLLLAAWPSIRRSVPDATLVLVGDGPLRAMLEARGSAGVRLVGERDDVPLWLAAADVVAAPSRWEGMSLSVLEAMASGRSIVATDVAGMGELLAGNAGAIVPRERPDALAQALIDRLADSARASAEGVRARRRVEASHDLSASLRAMVALYEEALGARR